MKRLLDFAQLFALYKRHNSAAYSARIAYGIAFRNLPF
jgi:hypothetical protein